MSSPAEPRPPSSVAASLPARLVGKRTYPFLGLLLFVPAAATILSLVGACAILLRYSLNSWDPVHTMTTDLTGANYLALAGSSLVARAFTNTLRISATVTIVCLVFGYPVAYGISRSSRRDLLVFLLVAPLLIDGLLRAYGWLVMLSQRGLVNSLLISLGVWSVPRQLLYTELSVNLGLIHDLIPFMVLPIANALERIDPVLREAAMNLQAGPARTFLFVTFPLSIPGVIAGTVLTFTLCMSAFAVPLILGGGNVTTMTTLIQQQMLTTLNWPLGSAEAIVLVVAVLSLLIVYRRQIRRIAGTAA